MWGIFIRSPKDYKPSSGLMGYTIGRTIAVLQNDEHRTLTSSIEAMADSTRPLFSRSNDKAQIETGTDFQPLFDEDGLVPAIVQDTATNVVLMFAWMNADALAQTLQTGTAVFWSRSRQKLWRKGEESGNTLTVNQIQTDCDQDVVLLKVTINGNKVACHTGAPSCFYRFLSESNQQDRTFSQALEPLRPNHGNTP